jgi:hypothetical protein
VWLEGIGKLKKKLNDLIGTGTHFLPACTIVPQPGISLNTETLNWDFTVMVGFKTS